MHRRARGYFADAIKLTQHGNVGEMLTEILAAQHLGIGAIEGDADEKLARALTRNRIRVHHAADPRRPTRLDAQRFDAHGDLGDRRGSMQLVADPLAMAETHINGAIDYELRREGLANLQAVLVGPLPFGERFRGIGIGPPLPIPVIDMLAEYDEIRTVYGLSSIKLLQEVIGRWAGGTALGGEQLDKHGRIAPRGPRYSCEQRKNDRNRQPRPQAPPSVDRLCSAHSRLLQLNVPFARFPYKSTLLRGQRYTGLHAV